MQIKPLPDGAFCSSRLTKLISDLGIKLEAAGLASKTFWKLFRRQGSDQATMGGQLPVQVSNRMVAINADHCRMGVGTRGHRTGSCKGGKPVEGVEDDRPASRDGRGSRT